MTYALQHLKVIDAASYLAGPAAATVMADYGADVTKIEPLQGDGYRLLVGRYAVPYHWQLTSRNKRSLALDLRQAAGQDVLHKLIADADVLLTNFRPDQLSDFNMTFEQMSALNERLIVGHLTGYGDKGPDSNMRAFDVTAWWARSGMMDLVREPNQLPQQGAGGFGDHATAMSLFGAVMMALYQRERTGKGGLVSTSLAANGVWANGMQIQGKIAGFDSNAWRQKKGMRSPFGNTYKTQEGRYVVMCLTNPAKEWPALAAALGHREWLEDERFATARAVSRHQDEMRSMISAVIEKLSLSQTRSAMDEYSIAYGVVQNLDDVVRDEQLKINDIIVPTDSDHPDYQWTVGSPIQIAGQEKKPASIAPQVGEHSRQILAELGYSSTQISDMIQSGSVGEPVGLSDDSPK
ncbi:MAG: CoA transferase [bacterium]|nr:CoA transferase [Gammaproteobacteria bacterium]HIL96344.1 CoA transferase [Pseudomonadales bacterium]